MESKDIHKAQEILTRLSIAYIEAIQKKIQTGNKSNLKDLITKSQEITFVDSLLSEVEHEQDYLKHEITRLKALNKQQERANQVLQNKLMENL